jgi:hypothetical protein
MRKINILITTILLASLFIMPLVFAATTMSSPVTGNNYTGTMTVTVIYDGWNAVNMSNVTCYYNSSGGATGTTLVIISNTTSIQKTFTDSVAITSLSETSTYNISCNLNEATKTNLTLYASGITVDSTNPLCSLTKKYSNPPYKGIQQLIWTSSDALQLVSTAVTIDRPQTGADMTYTDSGRDLTLLSTDTNWIGSWTATVLATDRVGNTATCTQTWKSYLPDGEIEDAYAQEEAQAASNANLKGLLIVIGIGVGLYFIFKGK